MYCDNCGDEIEGHRAVASSIIGGGGRYSYIRVMHN